MAAITATGGQERPSGAVEADRLHGRLLSLADDPVGILVIVGFVVIGRDTAICCG